MAHRLREDILSGALPEGAQLIEREFAARYGVSRAPIREALREMTRLGVAVDLPRRGTFVSSPSKSDLEQVYYARDAIETAAVRLAIARAHDDELRALRDPLPKMEAAYRSGDYGTTWSLDLDFHRSLLVLGGNRQFLATFDQLASETVLLLRTAHERWRPINWVPPAEWEQDRVHRASSRHSSRATRTGLPPPSTSTSVTRRTGRSMWPRCADRVPSGGDLPRERWGLWRRQAPPLSALRPTTWAS